MKQAWWKDTARRGQAAWAFRISALAAPALLLSPGASMGNNERDDRGNASAGQEFRIVVPRVLRLLENTHPFLLAADAKGEWGGMQRLVVASNLQRGFCVSLRVSTPDVQAWRLSAPPSHGITLEAVQGGYRICSSRPGHHTLTLTHEFELTVPSSARSALRWPVQTDISAL